MRFCTSFTLFFTLAFAFALLTPASSMAADTTSDKPSAAPTPPLTDGGHHTLTVTTDKYGVKHYKTAGKVLPSSEYGKAFHSATTKYIGEITAKRANLIRYKLIDLRKIFLVSEKRVQLPANFQPFFSDKMSDEEQARAVNYLNDEIFYINVALATQEVMEKVADQAKK